MKLVSIQNTNAVLKSLGEKGVFEADSKYGTDLQICPRLINKMWCLMSGFYPIFSMKQFGDIELNKIQHCKNLDEVSDCFLNNMGVPLPGLVSEEALNELDQRMSIFLLEVPDEICIETHLYGWRASMVFESEYNNTIIENDEDSEWYGTYPYMMDNYIHPDWESIQVLIPYIKPKYILDRKDAVNYLLPRLKQYNKNKNLKGNVTNECK